MQSFSRTTRQKALSLAFVLIMLLIIITSCTEEQEQIETFDPDKASLPSDQQVLTELMSQANIASENITISDGKHIYFNDSDGNFVKSDADGANQKILLNNYVSWPVIDQNQIYYVSGLSQGELSKINTDGSNNVRIGSSDIKNLIFFDDMLYAIEMPEEQVVRYQTDGSRREVIIESASTNMILNKEALYISSKSAHDGLIRYDLKTDEIQVLIERVAGSLQIDKDWLYFADLQNQYHVYGISLQSFNDTDNDDDKDTDDDSDDDSDKETNQTKTPIKLESQLVFEHTLDKPFITFDGKLYYIDSNRQQQLFSIELSALNQLDSSKAVLVADDAVEKFVILYPFIYYQRPNHNMLFRVVKEQTRAVKIS